MSKEPPIKIPLRAVRDAAKIDLGSIFEKEKDTSQRLVYYFYYSLQQLGPDLEIAAKVMPRTGNPDADLLSILYPLNFFPVCCHPFCTRKYVRELAKSARTMHRRIVDEKSLDAFIPNSLAELVCLSACFQIIRAQLLGDMSASETQKGAFRVEFPKPMDKMPAHKRDTDFEHFLLSIQYDWDTAMRLTLIGMNIFDEPYPLRAEFDQIDTEVEEECDGDYEQHVFHPKNWFDLIDDEEEEEMEEESEEKPMYSVPDLTCPDMTQHPDMLKLQKKYDVSNEKFLQLMAVAFDKMSKGNEIAAKPLSTYLESAMHTTTTPTPTMSSATTGPSSSQPSMIGGVRHPSSMGTASTAISGSISHHHTGMSHSSFIPSSSPSGVPAPPLGSSISGDSHGQIGISQPTSTAPLPSTYIPHSYHSYSSQQPPHPSQHMGYQQHTSHAAPYHQGHQAPPPPHPYHMMYQPPPQGYYHMPPPPTHDMSGPPQVQGASHGQSYMPAAASMQPHPHFSPSGSEFSPSAADIQPFRAVGGYPQYPQYPQYRMQQGQPPHIPSQKRGSSEKK
ncbi:hypothetical protein ADUPG1_010749 [Aduncisulcus paluster]|uniref:Uncharacterized protein n=1 Tax=Aduncisulcus paluster TaxID=2918883 RepID=A0ABQ5JT13_9EUKA|nr:hypothetical protein ADUPG1_010749 [Aduncisulcus paluster]